MDGDYAFCVVSRQCLLHRTVCYEITMNDQARRLQIARAEAGYQTPTEAARALGVKESTYLGHENGSRGISRVASRYASFFGVSLDWLLNAKGSPKSRARPIPVVGAVGAGAEIAFFDDHFVGDGFSEIDALLPTPAVALEVKGDSMWPIQEGWRVVYRRVEDGVPPHVIGKLCVCRTESDLTLLKIVRRSAHPQLFELQSWNAQPREPEPLKWASPVIAILPR